MSHILVVDDEPGIRTMLHEILADEGYTSRVAASAEEALEKAAAELFDLALVDVWLPGIDGIELLERLRSAGHRFPVVTISGHATAELAVRAVREGAADFIEKPFSLDRVIVTVANVLAQSRLADRLAAGSTGGVALTGRSEAIGSLRQQISRAAPSDARVLVTGPNGAGKEVVARLLHQGSRRASGPFVAVNCAAIPAELIESELFGHLKGAFTGAVEARRGKFELAHGGTLFLDEVADMSVLTQAKVLRVLQESAFTRLGSSQEVAVDVRVIAATNKDLKAEIGAGRFREDLYFRLAVIPLRVPPLAERREDVPLLVEEFASSFAREAGVRARRFSREALDALCRYDWPGNVREVRNLVERLMVMVPGEVVDERHLQLSEAAAGAPTPLDGLPLREARERFEREYISRVLQACGDNVAEAARRLGLERSHLYRKIRSLGVR